MSESRGSAPGGRALAALLAAWTTLAVASIWLRPLWPVDETRYASVAWEMWLRGDFLVPYVNGEAYSQKPPLLFWLIHLGWAAFGVNDWWPRLVGPLCAFAAVPLLFRMEKLLWGARGISVWILFGTLLFAGFVTLTMFDLLLADCVLVAMVGVLSLWRGARGAGILWLGAGIGLGVLAKGPVVLLHVLPAALAAPWWAPELRARAGRWYGDLALGVLLGAAIALAWAVPAGLAGGEAYRRAIFWGQTAGRVADSFAHRAPWWYYAPLLPLILFPWLAWPRLWKALRELSFGRRDPGTRFLLAWLLLALAAFSLVSGKQAKYLVPELPAFALLAGVALERTRSVPRRWEMLLPLAGFLALPAFLLVLRQAPGAPGAAHWAAAIPRWPLVLAALAAPLLLASSARPTLAQVRSLAVAMLLAAALLLVGVVPAIVPYADPRPVAAVLARLERAQVPLAHLGKYHAQYNFAGRLRAPIEILDPPEVAAWVAAHPGGRVVTVERHRHPGSAAPAPEYEAPFRGAWLQVWRGPALLMARPELR
jgi:4-amino-4-deoxy-L-arabinose transferase-like glycosyltransferase